MLIVLPLDQVFEIMHDIHSQSGHAGIESVKKAVDQALLDIPKHVVEKFRKTCPVCLRQIPVGKGSPRVAKVPMTTMSIENEGCHPDEIFAGVTVGENGIKSDIASGVVDESTGSNSLAFKGDTTTTSPNQCIVAPHKVTTAGRVQLNTVAVPPETSVPIKTSPDSPGIDSLVTPLSSLQHDGSPLDDRKPAATGTSPDSQLSSPTLENGLDGKAHATPAGTIKPTIIWGESPLPPEKGATSTSDGKAHAMVEATKKPTRVQPSRQTRRTTNNTCDGIKMPTIMWGVKPTPREKEITSTCCVDSVLALVCLLQMNNAFDDSFENIVPKESTLYSCVHDVVHRNKADKARRVIYSLMSLPKKGSTNGWVGCARVVSCLFPYETCSSAIEETFSCTNDSCPNVERKMQRIRKRKRPAQNNHLSLEELPMTTEGWIHAANAGFPCGLCNTILCSADYTLSNCGGRFTSSTNLVKWPLKLLPIVCPNGQRGLVFNQIPERIETGTNVLKFRGVVVCSGTHYNAIARLPNCYAHYEPYLSTIRTHPLSISKSQAKKIQDGDAVALVLFEVCEAPWKCGVATIPGIPRKCNGCQKWIQQDEECLLVKKAAQFWMHMEEGCVINGIPDDARQAFCHTRFHKSSHKKHTLLVLFQELLKQQAVNDNDDDATN